MKRMLSLACILLLGLSGCASATHSEENPFRLKSSVYEACNTGDTFETHCSYDPQGNISRDEVFINGELNCTIDYEYDEWGNLLRQVSTHSDGTVTTTEYVLTLDEDHRILYQESFSNGILKDVTEMAYDKQGNQILLQSKNITEHGKEYAIRHIEMIYDQHSNLTKKVVQWLDDPSRDMTIHYTYENGRCIREESYFSTGKLCDSTEYIYDDSNMTHTSLKYDGIGLLFSKTLSTYDAYGNELKREYYQHAKDVPGTGDAIADNIYTYTYERID